jgi:hypothetical protein
MLQDLWEESSLKDALRDRAIEEVKREDIRAVLEVRFGPLDEALSAAIAVADMPALSALVVPSATEPLEQIRARLGLS